MSSNPEHIENAQTLLSALETQVSAQTAQYPKSRPADPSILFYRVGQLVRHVRRSYHGVIYGWDRSCAATAEYAAFKRLMIFLGTYVPFVTERMHADGFVRCAWTSFP